MNCMQITMENENNKHLGDTEQFVKHSHNNHLRKKKKHYFFLETQSWNVLCVKTYKYMYTSKYVCNIIIETYFAKPLSCSSM